MPRRIAVAALAALACAAFVWSVNVRQPGYQNDFDQWWMAARLLLEHREPYAVIGPGSLPPYRYPWPFYYPMPAAFIGAPFVWLPVDIARIAFAGVSGFLLTFALGGVDRPYRYTPLLSGAFLAGIQHGQLAPLFLAAMLAGGWWQGIAAFKPNVGIAMLAGARKPDDITKAVIGGAILCALALIVSPYWPGNWIRNVSLAPQTVSLFTRAGGVVLLLSVLRVWQSAPARVLFALAVVPATPGAMEPLLFFGFPMKWRNELALALLTHLPPMAVTIFLAWRGQEVTIVRYLDTLAVAMLWIVYVPVLVAVLRGWGASEAVERLNPAPRRRHVGITEL